MSAKVKAEEKVVGDGDGEAKAAPKKKASAKKPATARKTAAKSAAKASAKSAADGDAAAIKAPAKKAAAPRRGNDNALVIVESPAKAKTIKKYLGSGYVVKASVGHVKDLPKKTLGIDVDNDFLPEYVVIDGKK